MARKSAFTKAKNKNIIVIEDFSMESPSTKGYVKYYLI